jgi:hypothetical protein
VVDKSCGLYDTWGDVGSVNAGKGWVRMTDVVDAGVFVDYMVERVKRLEGELREAREALGDEGVGFEEGRRRMRRRKHRKGARPRVLARGGPEEGRFIRMRATLVRKHARRGFAGEPITTAELIEKHREQGGRCYYTGLPYECYEGSVGVLPPLSLSVDRIDPGAGYTRENVVLCAWFMNCAKNAWPLALIQPLWRYLPKGVAPGTAERTGA